MSNKDLEDLQSELKDKSYFLNEIAAMTKTGSFSGNMLTGETYMDDIAREILKIADDKTVSLNDSLKFHVDENKAARLFQKCINGETFKEILQMYNSKGEKIWVQAAAKPYLSEAGEIIGFRGVFTSIEKFVKQGKTAEKRLKIIRAQNERLLHFAHIISHNIRSHASNLQLTLETFDLLESAQDANLAFHYLKDVSDSLNRTLVDLNNVVTVHTQRKDKENLSFKDVFNLVLNKYQDQLDNINGTLNYDFSNHPNIFYVPSFLESIFDNLISNAIKYRNDSRDLVINVYLKIKKGRPILYVEDNGSGIDLKRHKNKVFKMYSKFHENDESAGIGLFIVKNQVESLYGSIKVESELDKGSKFIIYF